MYSIIVIPNFSHGGLSTLSISDHTVGVPLMSVNIVRYPYATRLSIKQVYIHRIKRAEENLIPLGSLC